MRIYYELTCVSDEGALGLLDELFADGYTWAEDSETITSQTERPIVGILIAGELTKTLIYDSLGMTAETYYHAVQGMSDELEKETDDV